jgi:uncharacterized membrane protein YgdD (TMEM256/DUF423 family)
MGVAPMASQLATRVFSTAAALACAGSCALAAYASHVAGAADAKRLAVAAAFMFAHALAYFCLRSQDARIEKIARALLVFALIFSLSLILSVFAGVRPWLAPYAGFALILTWVMLAISFALSTIKVGK